MKKSLNPRRVFGIAALSLGVAAAVFSYAAITTENMLLAISSAFLSLGAVINAALLLSTFDNSRTSQKVDTLENT